MLTLFTPTHNTKYLSRLAASIEVQTSKDFEWLIVPNGSVTVAEVRAIAPFARIITYTGKTQNIGELKRFCCENARGDILVEVDHDDELMPRCVEVLAAEMQDCDFAYSNFATISYDKPFCYGEHFGWQSKPITLPNGREALENVAFEPSPASISRIWYGPNHVRSWNKKFYDKIGGHDASMGVLDDHDLMCRTYIHGTMKHIDECLYIYHIHGENSYLGMNNAFIQTETLNIHDKYIYSLAEKWANINKLYKIDLCGGHGKPEGYIGVDLANSDITVDLNGPWPFQDGSVGVIRAHDAIEHLRNPIHTMKEVYRVLAPGGLFLTMTPSTDGRGAFQDPTHVSFWNRNSFLYYTNATFAKYIGTPVRFQELRVKDFFPSEWHRVNNCPYIKADLLKEMPRTPGGMNI